MTTTFAGLDPEMFLGKRSFFMKARMYGEMRAAAYDLLDAIRSAHTGKRCVPPDIAAMPMKCPRQPKWSAASSGASWQPALSGGGPKPLLLQVQRRRMKSTPQRGLTHRSSESGIEEPIQRRHGSFKKARPSEFYTLHIARQALALLLALVLLLPAYPQSLVPQDQQDPAQTPSRPPYIQETPEQLQQLVAPIALYPDSLVAQVLAASTFPEQVVEADRWVQSHPDLKGEALALSVDQMPWDPSVKALVAFPSVLGNMDKNLSWTSSLGDAYYNQEQGIMDAVQVLRRGAQKAGNLNSTEQQTVITEGSDIQIEPVRPEIVYVPAYDPWNVYGDPIVAWPGWYPYPGIWYEGPALFFGVGFGIGFFGHYGWGWHHWGCDWHHHHAVFDHARYSSHSRTFYNRDRFYRGGGDRGVHNGGERTPQPFGGNRGAARGYAPPHGQSGVRSGAFSGFGHGGEERGFSSRGSASFGGGGGFHGGGHR